MITLHYFPRNWGWYIAAVFLFGPYVLIRVMENDVMARVIGLSFWITILIPVILYAIFIFNEDNYNEIVPRGWLEKNK